MELAIVGYGRMGREVAEIAAERGHEVRCTVDSHAGADFDAVRPAIERGAIEPATTVIEFALADGIKERVEAYAQVACSVVIGTTGWDEQRDEVLSAASAAGLSLVWGANFSVGANLFARTTSFAARLAERVGGYDAGIIELHHRGKKDSPSGTALMLAEGVLAELSGKDTRQIETLHRQITEEELHIVSGRFGSIPGTHTLHLDSSADTLELTHRARTRQGFALGAVLAGEWVRETGGVHTVQEFFDHLFAT